MSEAPPLTTLNLEASSYKKRKRLVLNIKEKCDIIDKLKQGRTVTSITREYGVCRSTIWGIKQNELKILKFSAQIGTASHQRKTMKKSEDNNLDAAVYKWFNDRSSDGTFLSNQMICDEALRLNKELDGDADFKATRGWLRRFRARHDITSQNSANKDRSGDELHSIADTEESFRVTPVNEKDEENDLNGQRGGIQKDVTDQNGLISVVPEASIKKEEPTEIIDDDQDIAEEVPPRKPTDEEAFNAIDIAIQWAELQREVTIEQLMFLRTLQSLSAKRALASISRGK